MQHDAPEILRTPIADLCREAGRDDMAALAVQIAGELEEKDRRIARLSATLNSHVMARKMEALMADPGYQDWVRERPGVDPALTRR